jgi:hypothetical protein
MKAMCLAVGMLRHVEFERAGRTVVSLSAPFRARKVAFGITIGVTGATAFHRLYILCNAA